MIRQTLHNGWILILGLLASSATFAQSSATFAPSMDTPQTRLRPIGAPSVVDQFRLTNQQVEYRETVARANPSSPSQADPQVQQAVWMQNFDLPPDGFRPPPTTLPEISAAPAPALAPRGLPVNPAPNQPAPFTPAPQYPHSNSDYAPLSQPQLSNSFATLDNSCHVSGPSTYTAASASGCCAPVGYQAPPAYIAPPAPIAPAPSFGPAVVVPGAPVGAAPGTGIPRGPLISFGQERNQVQVGPGLFGQPVAYVPGQTFRNWIRYIFP